MRSNAGEYAILQNEGEAKRGVHERRGPTTLQWVGLVLLTLFAGGVLVTRVRTVVQAAGGVSLQPLPASAFLSNLNLTQQQQQLLLARAQKKRRWSNMFAMGHTGTSAANFLLRTRRRSIKKQAAKAATRSVVLIGSQFSLGNELLKRVFGELCQRSRLALRCEPVWGGAHDLKSLSSFKAKRKRLVWLESDARKLRKTFRGVRTHASDYRLVHILWDPVHACSAQWALTQTAPPTSRSRRCARACTWRRPSRCSSAQSATACACCSRGWRTSCRASRRSGPPAWRHLFKFLDLPERAGDLTAIATRAIAELELRSKVLNKATQGRATALIATNETLYEDLRRLRRELEYTGAGKPGVGSLLAGRQLDVE